MKRQRARLNKRRRKAGPGIRTAVVITVAAITSSNFTPAFALPGPRPEEWWFDAWEIKDKLWPITQGSGVTVAVIDRGVEARLPDLKGVVIPGIGYGDASRKDGRADDDSKLNGHGTAMAALIAGQGYGTGMVGIAPKSKILPISDDLGNFQNTIRFAVDHGAKVINISEGGPSAYCPIDIRNAVSYAVQHDVVIVASAGNDALEDSVETPADCKGVLAVGAVDAHLNVWSKSSPGGNVMLAAPGVMVGSIGRDGIFNADNSGTSQAAALTSGVVALMRSHFPKMPASEIVQRLLATAKDVAPQGWDKRSGYGAIIPYKALTARVSKGFPNPVYGSGVPEGQNGNSGDQRELRSQTPAGDGSPRPSSRADDGPTQRTAVGIGLAGFAVAAILGATAIFGRRRLGKAGSFKHPFRRSNHH